MDKTMDRLARAMAILGGLVLIALIVLTSISVLGRGLNTLGHSGWLTGIAPELAKSLIAAGVGPVTGDFELMEAGIAFAVFAFLPLCQLHKSHAMVDVFTNFLPRSINQLLITVWELVLSGVMLLISWRLCIGMLDKLGNQETTFILQFPVWWAYALSFAASLIAALIAVYSAVGHVRALLKGEVFLPATEGAIH